MNQNILKTIKQSFEHLMLENENLTVDDLEVEIINLASYLYLRDTSEIDFLLDYLDNRIIDQIEGNNLNIVDKVIDGAALLYSKFYKGAHVMNAKDAVRMNLRLADNYGSFLKAYFISKHHIDGNGKFIKFSSPKNSLWINGVKQSESPTQRDVLYSFDNNTFEILILPYNPKVVGKIINKTRYKIKCVSYDKSREFEFRYMNGQLFELVMHRIDKGDAVKYHKN